METDDQAGAYGGGFEELTSVHGESPVSGGLA